jgi:hypothetical protein
VFSNKSILNRNRLRTEGKMAKATGAHAVFFKPYTTKVSGLFVIFALYYLSLQVPQGVLDSDQNPDRIEFGEIEPGRCCILSLYVYVY